MVRGPRAGISQNFLHSCCGYIGRYELVAVGANTHAEVAVLSGASTLEGCGSEQCGVQPEVVQGIGPRSLARSRCFPRSRDGITSIGTESVTVEMFAVLIVAQGQLAPRSQPKFRRESASLLTLTSRESWSAGVEII